ncbi:uncharacterized protein V1518DRAFT_415556 [Limtongia smithiae]|uniref:uncharacterized protein n=1 Tax=Limtongia smithiae TaxID=1125753 RepID=UPI0034CE0DD6
MGYKHFGSSLCWPHMITCSSKVLVILPISLAEKLPSLATYALARYSHHPLFSSVVDSNNYLLANGPVVQQQQLIDS